VVEDRHKPDQDAVREQMREEEDRVEQPGPPPTPAEGEDTVTSREESGEPAGDEDASNEAEREAETDRPTDDGETEARAEEEAEPEDPLARAEAERDRYLELAQRTQADFENYRKRAAKEAALSGERAKSGLVRELLPVVDNLERALATAQGAREAGHPASGGEDEQHLAEGVRLVHSELIAVLERNGVEQFDPRGESFDPSVHEALSTRSDGETGPGVVLDVVEKGYRTNGTVLRPARVVVSG
jgi:molecular chaperone GrpE